MNRTLGVGVVALQSCLNSALMELAAHHGNKPGKWLDNLEDSFIKQTKGTCANGVSFEDEIKIMKGALLFIQIVVDNVRERLSGPQNDN